MTSMAANHTLLCIHRDPAQLSLLKENGYDLVTAGSGSDALQLFISLSVDAVVLDCELSLLLGAAVAAEMKKLKPQVPTNHADRSPAIDRWYFGVRRRARDQV
jgi:DNA-binding NtrC family response regulator